MATAERHIERSVTAEAYCRRTAYVSACCRPPSVPWTDAWRCDKLCALFGCETLIKC